MPTLVWASRFSSPINLDRLRMLRSMTGQGQAQQSADLGTITVEIRTVNNRGLKLSSRLSDRLGKFESKVDAVVREFLSRGTINLNARWQRTDLASAYSLNSATLASYYRQLSQLHSELGASAPIDLSQLVALPGVVEDAGSDDIDEDALWNHFDAVLREALTNLNDMRTTEGASMGEKLLADHAEIKDNAASIQKLAPQVVEGYREKLESKVTNLLSSKGLDIAQVDVIKEVQLFADRSDISEELTRLDSHLVMFTDTMESENLSGRRLDFVIQEMFRETNTIGSKASNAEIAQHVVDMKCAIERMRELVQNIE